MKKTLYIISKPPDVEMKELLSFPVPADHLISAILIQQGIGFNSTESIPLFALENDIFSNQLKDSYSKIQYSDMLRMIFEADTVISI